MVSAIGAAVMAVISVLSLAYSVYSGVTSAAAAKRAKNKAKKAADKAKGFQLVEEGSAQPVAIAFGRNKIGGARVHTVVKDDYFYRDTPANATYLETSPLELTDHSFENGGTQVQVSEGTWIEKLGSADSWDSFLFSNDTVKNPSLKVRIYETDKFMAAGFSTATSASLRSFSYAWYFGKDGKAWILTNVLINTSGKFDYLFGSSTPTAPAAYTSVSYAVGDIFKIVNEGNTVVFTKNDVVIHTISNRITDSYLMFAFKTPGARFGNCTLTGTRTAYETFTLEHRKKDSTIYTYRLVDTGGSYSLLQQSPPSSDVPHLWVITNDGYEKWQLLTATVSHYWYSSEIGYKKLPFPKVDFIWCYPISDNIEITPPFLGDISIELPDNNIKDTNNMTHDIDGKKREFIFTQQALTQGTLSDIISCDIDDQPYTSTKFNVGIMIQAHLQGGVANPMMTANDSTRADSRFTSVAYATGAFKLDRDNPQYSGVPEMKFYVEGNKVRNTDGLTELGQSYSNNPARVLLEYLRNDTFGVGLLDSQIDYPSFKRAIDICDRIVVDSAETKGAIWESRQTVKQIRLFECNITLSSADSFRDNVNKIMETMGTAADLIWSAGKYKLIVNYPEVYSDSVNFSQGRIVQYMDGFKPRLFRSVSELNLNCNPLASSTWSEDVLVAEIDDDSLVVDENVIVTWPSLDTKLNFATVRFLNEEKDFQEDSTTWPDKEPIPVKMNVTFTYAGNTLTFSEKITLLAGAKILINKTSGQVAATVDNDILNSTTGTVTWLCDEAAKEELHDKGYIYYTYDDKIYDTYLAEDMGQLLESDEMVEGISTVQHAKAIAEQKVRTSRHITTYKFSTTLNYFYLEPGDLVGFQSETFEIPYTILKIDAVESDGGGKISIEASSFDARYLAWNIADYALDEFARATDPLVNKQARSLHTITEKDPNAACIYRLVWEEPLDATDIVGYYVRYTTDTFENITSATVWSEWLSTSNTSCHLPGFDGTYVFTVVPYTSDLRTPPMIDHESGTSWPFLEIELISDTILTPAEKAILLEEWLDFVDEQDIFDAQATLFDLSTEYNLVTSAFTTLGTYLNNGVAYTVSVTPPALFSSMNTNTQIHTIELKAQFNNYYTVRNAFINAANGAAYNDAASANAMVEEISSDSSFSPVEKQAVLKEWIEIVSEKIHYAEQCVVFDMQSSSELGAYLSAYADLANYLNGGAVWTESESNHPLWLQSLNVSTAIIAETFRNTFKNYYSTRQLLANKIASRAAATAVWASITGEGRPEDYATCNRFRGVWSALDIEYLKGDEVLYEGCTWGANIPHTSSIDNAPPDMITVSNTWWTLRAAKGSAGTVSVHAFMANEACVIGTDADGNNQSNLATDNDLWVYEGSIPLDYSETITNGTWKAVITTENVYPGAVTYNQNWLHMSELGTITADVGTITYTITGKSSQGEAFSFTKVQQVTRVKSGKAGAPATIYWLYPSTSVLKSDGSNFTPSSVVFSAKTKVGNTEPASYSGRFKIYENGSTTASYTSSSDETFKTWTPASNVTSLSCELYLSGGVTNKLDTQTVIVVYDGVAEAAITAILNNESCSIVTDINGNNGDYTAMPTDLYVFENNAPMPYSDAGGNGTWKIASVNSLSILPGALYKYSDHISLGTGGNISADTAKITFSISGTSTSGDPFTFSKTQSFTRVKNGGSSTAYWLVSSAHVLHYNGTSLTPATVTFTGMQQAGVANPGSELVKFKIYENGSATAAYTSSATETQKTYTPSSPSISQLKCEMYLSDGVTKLDEQTITVVSDGSQPVVGYLTNETFSYTTDYYGSGTIPAGAGGTFKVYSGTTDVTTSSAFSVYSSSGASGTIAASTGIYTISGTSADVGTIVFKAVYQGTTLYKVYSISRSKAGLQGGTGAQGIPGTNAKALVLSGNKQAFTATDGNLDGGQGDAVITSTLSNIYGTVSWSSSPSVTLSTTSTTASLTSANFGANKQVVITGSLYYDGATYTDTITIVRLEKSTAAAGATVGARAGSTLYNSGGSILADSAILNSLVTVGSSQINSGAVGSTQLGTSAVITDKIANNAVSYQTAATTTAFQSTTSTSYSTRHSMYVTKHYAGSYVFVMGVMLMSGNGTIGFYRDGSLIFETSINSPGLYISLPFSHIDTGATSSNIPYVLQFKAISGQVNSLYANFYATEIVK